MERFSIDKITGFEIVENPVIILDFRGIEFYSTVDLSNAKKFNLPPGTYILKQGEINPLKIPIRYRLNSLPPIERFYPSPINFEIVFENNPNKASIDWREKRIIFDPALIQKSLPELYFILFHEFAHQFYQNEIAVDALAENLMLKKGFNPSQTGSAPITTLSEKQIERKKDAVIRNIKFR